MSFVQNINMGSPISAITVYDTKMYAISGKNIVIYNITNNSSITLSNVLSNNGVCISTKGLGDSIWITDLAKIYKFNPITNAVDASYTNVPRPTYISAKSDDKVWVFSDVSDDYKVYYFNKTNVLFNSIAIPGWSSDNNDNYGSVNNPTDFLDSDNSGCWLFGDTTYGEAGLYKISTSSFTYKSICSIIANATKSGASGIALNSNYVFCYYFWTIYKYNIRTNSIDISGSINYDTNNDGFNILGGLSLYGGSLWCSGINFLENPPPPYSNGRVFEINTTDLQRKTTVNIGAPLNNDLYGTQVLAANNYVFVVNGNGTISNLIPQISINSTNPVICFKEDSKILCLVNNVEQYIPIQNIREGVLVKTFESGYKRVDMIGKSKIYNPENTLRCKNRLYKCKKENYPELTEDLIVTGCHSILTHELSEKQRELTIELLGDIYVTERHYRLMACIDDKCEPYTEEGLHNIYHIALENTDIYMNYGVYANGLLVESTSKRMLKEFSGMELLK
jgi:hypothetical protein